MPFHSLLSFLRAELWFFAGGLAVLILFRCFTGEMNLDRLLRSKTPGNPSSPARQQLLLFTLAAAVCYAWQCYQEKKLGPVPTYLNTAVGGSNLLYLFRKFSDTQPN